MGSRIYIIQWLILSYIAAAGSDTSRGGVPDSANLIRYGDVYMTQLQKKYFRITDGGYAKKGNSSWNELTVCSSKKRGLNYVELQTNFSYILCPLSLSGHGSDKNLCCGDKGKQRCCDLVEYGEFVRKVFLLMLIVFIAVPLICLLCCVGLAIHIFVRLIKPGGNFGKADGQFKAAPAYKQQQQQQQQQQQPYPQQPYPEVN